MVFNTVAVQLNTETNIFILCLPDCRGNTVLGVLCDGAPFGMDRFWEERSLIEGDAGHLQGKGHFIDHLLSQKDIQVSLKQFQHCSMHCDSVFLKK